MGKRHTFESRIITEGCVKPEAKKEAGAVRKGNLVEANFHAAWKNYCKFEAEKTEIELSSSPLRTRFTIPC